MPLKPSFFSVSRLINPRKLALATAFFAFLLPFSVGFIQYIETALINKIDRIDESFFRAIDRLGSSNNAVRAEAIRSIYSVSFERSPIEPSVGLAGFFSNIVNWMRGPEEYRALDKGRALIVDYARTARDVDAEQELELLSTTLGVVIINWMESEKLIESETSEYEFMLLKANLPYANLSRVSMAELNISGADLSNADLSYSNLSKVFLGQASLENAKLNSTILEEATLNSVLASNSNFRFARGNDAVFERAVLENADFGAVVLESANFKSAILIGSSFASANVRGSDFSYANLEGANFAGANLENVIFLGANLRGADLRYAQNLHLIGNIAGADLDGALLPQGFFVTDEDLGEENE